MQCGRDAVLAARKPFFEGPTVAFSWEPDPVDVLDAGGWALSTGPARDPAGKAVARFNSVWQRQGDGRWRVIVDKGSLANPPVNGLEVSPGLVRSCVQAHQPDRCRSAHCGRLYLDA